MLKQDMSRAERRRKARHSAREARSTGSRLAAMSATKRKAEARRKVIRAPSPALRVRALGWCREFLVSLWQHEIWPWRIAYRVGARIVGVDPDERVDIGHGKPAPNGSVRQVESVRVRNR